LLKERWSNLKILAERIRERLDARKFCVVFESELERIWPREKYTLAQRKKQIAAFANAYRLDVTIWDPGLRVTFKKRAKS